MKRAATALSVAIPAVKQERDRFVAFAFAAADMLLELDTSHHILYLDGATTGFLGGSTKKWTGKDFSSLVVEEDLLKFTEAMQQTESRGRINQCRLHLHTKLYKSLPVLLSGLKLPNQEDRLYITLTVLTGEMSPEELQERDIKSGLFQKQDYAKKAQQRIKKAKDDGTEAKLALIDIPGLKEFLDSLDPESAATLMMEIADYLRGKSLDGDTAGLVGDGVYSFVHDASVTTEQLIKEVRAITQKMDPMGKGISPTVQSIKADISQLTEQDSANAILYTLNRFAHDGAENFALSSLQQGYQTMLTETLEKISSFKQTVSTDDFKLAFQPIVDLKNGIIHHYETLVRFDSKEFSNPFHFITFGEQTGLINDFDLAMCQRCLLVLDDAAKKGQYPIISVNLSGRSLSSGLFMEAILKMVREAPHLHKQLIFEITESAKIENMEVTNNFIQELRKKGHQCCLDDFGVAESSFEYLRNLHVDFVKIDGSYVRDVISSPRGRSVLRAMAGMCRSLGITTIGEMIEDEKTATTLWDSGVHFGQGYFFGKPTLDAEELINCNKQTPFYQGIMRAKRLPDGNTEREWWQRKE